jgi:hypothetical protein
MKKTQLVVKEEVKSKEFVVGRDTVLAKPTHKV